MRLLDYLRARIRRRKPATGGFVRFDPDAPLLMLSSCQFAPAQPVSAQYEGVTFQMRGYTEWTDEERQQFLDNVNALMGRPKPGQHNSEHDSEAVNDQEAPPNG